MKSSRNTILTILAGCSLLAWSPNSVSAQSVSAGTGTRKSANRGLTPIGGTGQVNDPWVFEGSIPAGKTRIENLPVMARGSEYFVQIYSYDIEPGMILEDGRGKIQAKSYEIELEPFRDKRGLEWKYFMSELQHVARSDDLFLTIASKGKIPPPYDTSQFDVETNKQQFTMFVYKIGHGSRHRDTIQEWNLEAR